MAFNSNTYYANKAAREAWALLAKARDIKARVAAGVAYDWEAPRLPLIVGLARSSMRTSRFFRSLNRPRS